MDARMKQNLEVNCNNIMSSERPSRIRSGGRSYRFSPKYVQIDQKAIIPVGIRINEPIRHLNGTDRPDFGSDRLSEGDEQLKI
jgi:hypothetical protein